MTQPQSFPPWKPPEPHDRAFRPALRQPFRAGAEGSGQLCCDQPMAAAAAADLEFLNDIDNLNNDWPDYQEFRNDCLSLPGEPFGSEAQMLTPWREDEPMEAGEQVPGGRHGVGTGDQGEQQQQHQLQQSKQQSKQRTEGQPSGPAADPQLGAQTQGRDGGSTALAMPPQSGEPAVELMQLMGGSTDPVAALHEQYQGIVAQQQALLVKFHQLETAKHTLLRSHNLPLPPAHPPEALEAMATAAQPLPRDMFGALLPLLAAQQLQRQQQQAAQPAQGMRLPESLPPQQQPQQQEQLHGPATLQQGVQGQSCGLPQSSQPPLQQQQQQQQVTASHEQHKSAAASVADAARQSALNNSNAAAAAAAAAGLGPFSNNGLLGGGFPPQSLASIQYNPVMAAAAAAVAAAAAGMGPQAAAIPSLLDWIISAGQPQQNWMGAPGGLPGNGDAAAQMATMAAAAAAANPVSQAGDAQRVLGKRSSESMDFAQAHHAKLGQSGSHGSTSTAVPPPNAASMMGPGQLDPAAMLALANASTMHALAGGGLPPIPGGFSITGSGDSAMDCTSFLPPAYLAAAAQTGMVQQPQASQQRSQATVGNGSMLDKSGVPPSDVASSGAGCAGGGGTPSRHNSGSIERERRRSGSSSRAGKGSTKASAAQKGSGSAVPPEAQAQLPPVSGGAMLDAGNVANVQPEQQQQKEAAPAADAARPAPEAAAGPASCSMPPPPRQPQQMHQQEHEQQQQQAADDKQFAAALDAANAAIAALERSNSHALASTRAGLPGALPPDAEAQQQAMLSSIQQMAAAANLGLGGPALPGLLPSHMWQQAMPVPPQALLDPMQWQQAMQWQSNLAASGSGMPSMGNGSMGTGLGGSLATAGVGSMGLAPSSSMGTGLGGSMGAAPAALQPPLRPPLVTEAERQLLLRTRHAIVQLPQPVRTQLQEQFSAMAHMCSDSSRGSGSRVSVVAHVRELVQQALLGEHGQQQQQMPDALLPGTSDGVGDMGGAAGCAEQSPSVGVLNAAMGL